MKPKKWIGTSAAVFFLLAAAAAAAPAAAGDERPQLGVYLQELSDSIRDSSGYDGEGVLIIEIVEGSAAEEAGLKAGDIIAAFNGRKVASADELKKAIYQVRIGDEAQMLVFSGGTVRTVTVAMGKSDEEEEIEARELMEEEEIEDLSDLARKWVFVSPGERVWLGVGLMDVRDQLAEYFAVDQGVLITHVDKDSPAERAGLKAGDVLTAWDGSPVKSSTELYKALENAEAGREAAVSFVRRSEQQEATIVPEKRKRGHGAWMFDSSVNPVPWGSYRNFVYPDVPGVPSAPPMDVPLLPDLKELQHLKELSRLKALEKLKGLERLKELESLEELKGLDELREQMKQLREEIEQMRQQLDETRNEVPKADRQV